MPEHVVEFGRSGKPPEPDGRLDAPAFHRNQAAIWSVLADRLTERKGDVLEIGSGTGQHAVAFAQAAPAITWWPSDYNDKHLASIAAWRAHAALANLRTPVRIDLLEAQFYPTKQGLPAEFLAIVCINVLHISPWKASEHLLALAARGLESDGQLFVYGPFMRNGQHTAPSNVAFDAGLRADNPEWGVRDITDLSVAAARVDLTLADAIAMPANNFVLIFARRPK
jgi:SAM-dependent methyltransferase